VDVRAASGFKFYVALPKNFAVQTVRIVLGIRRSGKCTERK